MNVLVDTSVWSVSLRRKQERLKPAERQAVDEWAALVKEGRARLIGPVRQELLSGIKTETQFQLVRERLEPFPNEPIVDTDYVNAAAFFNNCRRRGISATPIDLLICAVAHRLRLPIFSLDADFQAHARLLPIGLHSARTASA